MSAQRSRALPLALEALERRETPGSLGAAHAAVAHHAGVSELAKKVKAPATVARLSLDSNGRANVTFSEGIQQGQTVTTVLTGRNKALGRYTAELNVFYGLGPRPAGTGTGTLTDAKGNVFDLRVSSKIRDSSPDRGQHGVLHIKVIDGLGLDFTTATGSGTIVGRVNTLYPYHYHLTGNVREVL